MQPNEYLHCGEKTVVNGSPDVVLGRELNNISGVKKSCFPHKHVDPFSSLRGIIYGERFGWDDRHYTRQYGQVQFQR